MDDPNLENRMFSPTTHEVRFRQDAIPADLAARVAAHNAEQKGFTPEARDAAEKRLKELEETL